MVNSSKAVCDVVTWTMSPLNQNTKIPLNERRMCSVSESDEGEVRLIPDVDTRIRKIKKGYVRRLD